MYLFRALNEFDINSNIEENGIASKKLLYDITYSYYKTNKEFKQLNKVEKDIFIKNNINNYILHHKTTLKKKYLKYCKELFDTINKIRYQTSLEPEIFMKTIYYISTLNNHLINGNNTYTEWISLTKKISGIDKYYQNQQKHYVALIKSETNGYIGEHTLTVDVSSREMIDNDKVFCNKIKKEDMQEYLKIKDIDLFVDDLVTTTKKQFRGYNYSIKDQEFCCYQYIPNTQVVKVLDALQVDLIKCGLFNEQFLNLNKQEQIKSYKEFKNKLLKLVVMMKDPYMLYVYEQLYLDNNNINTITTEKTELEKIKYTKKLILGLASKISDIQIIDEKYR